MERARADPPAEAESQPRQRARIPLEAEVLHEDPNDRFGKWTDPARRALQIADQEARRIGSRAIDVGHVLLGLIRQPDSNAGLILRAYSVTLETVEIVSAPLFDQTTSP